LSRIWQTDHEFQAGVVLSQPVALDIFPDEGWMLPGFHGGFDRTIEGRMMREKMRSLKLFCQPWFCQSCFTAHFFRNRRLNGAVERRSPTRLDGANFLEPENGI
jgi:hypothetical protein